ncbi:LysM domain protein [Peptococcaceae bacterium CEB3]|nr:LysM domain protein [Peptococcaceae bacterium CEB3]
MEYKEEKTMHVVRRGETLHLIAKRNRTSVTVLLRLNPKLRCHPNLIYVGERIRVH